ncbi:porin family protein [Nitrosomonas sp. Is37]|uniref:porin family protein n=1 Tax=Nitrosomonas sp. Is37 TaxID=3080535 RepID=UPI00294AF481|nr:porin family protein [Nitrosomonas sp. Is37]MDV6345450.1 porin family protein [Nitrosomonas sp. Is37]
MKKFRLKTRVASVAVSSLIIALATGSPQALAHGGTSTEGLEQQIKLLEGQLKAIRDELNQVKSKAAQDQQEIKKVKEENQQEIKKVKEEIVREDRMIKKVEEQESKHHHMIFFRGGYAHNLQERNGASLQSNVVPIGAQDAGGNDGWYVGAGFDFSLTKDVWGFLPGTEVLAELMFEYKRFGHSQGNALANAPSQLAGGAFNPRSVTISQFTLTAAPKIKFMEGSNFRPWIIPAGLAMHVVSPATESVTYVANPGYMVAVGADYRFWKNFVLGVDARYHEVFGKFDGVNLSGMTAGGYLGIGF